MTRLISFSEAQSRHDNSLPPEDGPEPTEAMEDEAFDELVANSTLLSEYIELVCPVSILHVIQAYNEAGGLPRRNKTPDDDQAFERLTDGFDDFLRGYRQWLGQRLVDQADIVMQRHIENAKEDAESDYDPY